MYTRQLLLLLLLLFSVLSFAQQKDIQVKTHDLGNGVYMLTGSGGNVGVSIGDDGVFIIDDQYAPMHDKIVAAIQEMSSAPIRFVINTHWHGDHTGGNELFVAKQKSTIIAHDNVRQTMAEPQIIRYFKSINPPSPEKALPVITYGDNMTLHLNKQEVFIFHTANAHTNGDSIIHFKKANIIHMGDTYFKGMYPFIDEEHGGSIAGAIATANKVLEIANEDTQIIPGHGSVSNIKELATYRDMLGEVQKRIHALVKEGLSLEQVLEKDALADLNDTWGNGFMKAPMFTEIIFNDLSKKK